MAGSDLAPDCEPVRTRCNDMYVRQRLWLTDGRFFQVFELAGRVCDSGRWEGCHGLDLGVHDDVARQRPIGNRGGVTLSLARLDHHVQYVVVDDDRAEPPRTTACALGGIEEAIVDDHLAGDPLDACRANLATRWSSPASGSPTMSLRGFPACVGVVVVLEEQGAVGPGPSAHAQVSLSNENQITVECSLRVDLAPPHDRSLKPAVGAQLDQRRGDAEQLGDRGGCKKLVAVVLVDRSSRGRIDHQDTPVASAVDRRFEYGFARAASSVPAWGLAACASLAREDMAARPKTAMKLQAERPGHCRRRGRKKS